MSGISKALIPGAFSFLLLLSSCLSVASCSSEAPQKFEVEVTGLWFLDPTAFGQPSLDLTHLVVSGSVVDADGLSDFGVLRVYNDARDIAWEYRSGDVSLEQRADTLTFALPVVGKLAFPPEPGGGSASNGAARAGAANIVLPTGLWEFEYEDLAGQRVATSIVIPALRYQDIASLLAAEPAEYWYFGAAGPVAAESLGTSPGGFGEAHPGARRVTVRRSPATGGFIYSF